MKDYLISFLKEYDFPVQSHAPLTEALEKLLCCERADLFLSFLDAYREDMKAPVYDYYKKMDEVSECAGVHPYTGVFLLLLLLTKDAKRHWLALGYSEALFHDTFLDLRYKLIECKLVKGVWGTFVSSWYTIFFRAKIFAFGRLQYECTRLGKDVKLGDLSLDKDTPVLSIHIPRTGTSIAPEEIDRSLQMAKEFFADAASKEHTPLIFYCHSWLLFPEHEVMLKESSNILAFSRRFTRIACGYNTGYGELWRYFDMDYTGNVDDLPATNSLYRAYIDRIRKGLPIGWGEGIILA